MRGVSLILAALAMPLGAEAQTRAPAPEQPATEVAGVTVVARRPTAVAAVDVQATWCPKADPDRYPARTPPRVVSTYPAQGTVVAPGVLTVSITFDQAMTCSWAVDYLSKGDEPCGSDGVWVLPDRRTWQVRCDVRSESDYKIRFGEPDGQPGRVRFTALSGQEATVFDLGFATSADRPIRSVVERAELDASAPRVLADASLACPDDDEGRRRTPCRHIRPPASAEAAVAP